MNRSQSGLAVIAIAARKEARLWKRHVLAAAHLEAESVWGSREFPEELAWPCAFGVDGWSVKRSEVVPGRRI